MSTRAAHRYGTEWTLDKVSARALLDLDARGDVAGVAYVKHACAMHGNGILYTLPVRDRLTRNGSYAGRERTHATWLTRTRAAERDRSVRVSDLRERCDAHTHTLRSARSIALASAGIGI